MENCETNANEYLKVIADKCRKAQIPYTANFELTPLCNFDCKMCYVHLRPEQMGGKHLLSKEQWIDFGRQAAKLGLTEIYLTGGEALTRSDFREIYDALYRMGLLITLRTNGYLLTEELATWLEARKPYKVQITLYGASDETYSKVCGVKDGYSAVIRNVHRLREHGIPFDTTMTVTAENEADVQILRAWAIEQKVHLTSFSGMFQPFENTGRSIDNLRARAAEIVTEEEMPTPEPTEPVTAEDFSAFRSCKMGMAQFTITWDGKMTPCTGINYLWVDPLAEPLKDAFAHMNEKVLAFRRPKKCWNCPYQNYCISCPSAYRLVDGEAVLTDTDCCDRARYRYKQAMLNKAASEGEK